MHGRPTTRTDAGQSNPPPGRQQARGPTPSAPPYPSAPPASYVHPSSATPYNIFATTGLQPPNHPVSNGYPVWTSEPHHQAPPSHHPSQRPEPHRFSTVVDGLTDVASNNHQDVALAQAFLDLQQKHVELRIVEERRREKEAELAILRLREGEQMARGVPGLDGVSSDGSSFSSPANSVNYGGQFGRSFEVPTAGPSHAPGWSTTKPTADASPGAIQRFYESIQDGYLPWSEQPLYPLDDTLRPQGQAYGMPGPAFVEEPSTLSAPTFPRLPNPHRPEPPPHSLPLHPDSQSHQSQFCASSQLSLHHTEPTVEISSAPEHLPSQSTFSRPALASSDPSSSQAVTSQSHLNSKTAKNKRILWPDQPLACCSDCRQPIARLLLRGEERHFEVDWEGVWVCKVCLDARRQNGEEVVKEEKGRRRKRNRNVHDIQSAICCDACGFFRGQGGIVAKDSKSAIEFDTELVCVTCDNLYSRCSDCGGGGGGRVGIGKWRSKELFSEKRKTCNLTHTRIGDAPLTFGVWAREDLGDVGVREELLSRCEALWREKILCRLAIPEILETEDGPDRSFAEIQTTLDEGWPGRNALFESDPSAGRRRFYGLTWCKTKPRRPAFLEDSSDDTPQSTEKADGLNNDDILPPNHDLVGLFLGHWKMNDGTLLITSSLPFGSEDGDDRSVLAVGEMACRIVAEIDVINQQRASSGQSILPPLEHLWVFNDNGHEVTRERMSDLLNRRRDFHPLKDYCQMHQVDPQLFQIDRPFYAPTTRPAWIMGGEHEDAEIMARYLGPHFDRQQLQEIAKSEFSKRLKAKKWTPKP